MSTKKKQIAVRKLLNINETLLIDIKFILSIEIIDVFENSEFGKGFYKYYIIINRTENKALPYGNTYVEFKTPELRLKGYNKILNELKKNESLEIVKI